MKINSKILSLPPYLSTSLKNILSLQVEARPFGHALIIELVSGNKVEIPNLDRPTIEKVFSMHVHTLEDENKEKNILLNTAAMPLPFILPNIENLVSMIQHNPEQKDAPPLPPEVLGQIASMTKGLLPEDALAFGSPEPDCQCPYCQITRAALGKVEAPAQVEEVVSEEDLKFRTWDIKQEGDKLYCVTNPLDQKEHYNVFLGDPLGCTCGHKNCEHIQAVLKS